MSPATWDVMLLAYSRAERKDVCLRAVLWTTALLEACWVMLVGIRGGAHEATVFSGFNALYWAAVRSKYNAYLQAIHYVIVHSTHTHMYLRKHSTAVSPPSFSRQRESLFHRFDHTGSVFHPVLQPVSTKGCFPWGKAIWACSLALKSILD
jgi:hypothetical protein